MYTGWKTLAKHSATKKALPAKTLSDHALSENISLSKVKINGLFFFTGGKYQLVCLLKIFYR